MELRVFRGLETSEEEITKHELLERAKSMYESAKLFHDFSGGAVFSEILDTCIRFLSSETGSLDVRVEELSRYFEDLYENMSQCYVKYSHAEATASMCKEVLQVVNGSSPGNQCHFNSRITRRLFCMMLYCGKTAQDLVVGFIVEKNEETLDELLSRGVVSIDADKLEVLRRDMEQVIRCIQTVYPDTVSKADM